MIRTLTLAAIASLGLSLPAAAQDKLKVEPGKGPTSTMTDQVPQMKENADGVKQVGPNTTAPDKAMGAATPSMKPGDPVSGQPSAPNAKSTAAPAPAGQATTTEVKKPGGALSEKEALAWVDKPVYSSDDKKIGEVEKVQLSPSGMITEIHAGVGGFFGIGETHIKLMPEQFALQADRVTLTLTAAQAKDQPKVTK